MESSELFGSCHALAKAVLRIHQLEARLLWGGHLEDIFGLVAELRCGGKEAVSVCCEFRHEMAVLNVVGLVENLNLAHLLSGCCCCDINNYTNF